MNEIIIYDFGVSTIEVLNELLPPNIWSIPPNLVSPAKYLEPPAKYLPRVRREIMMSMPRVGRSYQGFSTSPNAVMN